MYQNEPTELTLSEVRWSERHPVGSCSYCRSDAPSAYYALAGKRIIRRWLCQECVTEIRASGVEARSMECAECRVPSERHASDHTYVALGLGR